MFPRYIRYATVTKRGVRSAMAIDTLLKECNDYAPGRSKVSDGWIGDLNHSKRSSDHNPWVTSGRYGVVRAQDITSKDLPAEVIITAVLRASAAGHPAFQRDSYIIANGFIYSYNHGWAKRKYNGPNPHRTHTHVSVGTRGFDSRSVIGIWRAFERPAIVKPAPKRQWVMKGNDIAIVDLPRSYVRDKVWTTLPHEVYGSVPMHAVARAVKSAKGTYGLALNAADVRAAMDRRGLSYGKTLNLSDLVRFVNLSQ